MFFISRIAARHLLAVIFVVAVSGCATRSFPDRIDIATLKPSAARIAVVDERPVEARKVRTAQAKGGDVTFFADEAISPSLVELLASRLATTVPEAFRAAPIRLTRLDVGYVRVSSAYSSNSPTPNVVMLGAPAAATLIGNVVGRGLVEVLNTAIGPRTMIRDSGLCNIEISIGEHEITTAQLIPMNSGTTSEAAIEKAVADGLKNLAEKVDAMRYWERAPPSGNADKQ